MSRSKKEVHVNDLIIRADNVMVEQAEKESQPWVKRDVASDHHHDAEEFTKSDDEMDDDHDKRPPFSWI
ncbi:hypothetical protein ABID56_001451 [Alkalibacillus flavidus]|uniref:DUF4025 domain-containing protein n=1 Tax=Alkalibacillus flavidus TaxID=546021 RepID=A0ABV2KUV9_9BACI